MVLAAGHRSLPSSERALSQLCETYWYPLYAYVRRRVTDMHEAQDLTQAFFAQLLDKNFIGDADPQRGRFRTFLLAALNHFLANEWDKARAKKRGGDRIRISLDLGEGERRFCQEPATNVTAEKIYDRQWALTLLHAVLSELREEQEAGGKKAQFEMLEPFITGQPKETSYAEVAETLGATVGAVKVTAHRLRRRYQQMLQEEIAQTLTKPEDVEDEIRGLFETFGK